MKGFAKRYGADVGGMGSLGLIAAGAWSLWGWQWAAIIVGAPGVAFYVWGEIRQARG